MLSLSPLSGIWSDTVPGDVGWVKKLAWELPSSTGPQVTCSNTMGVEGSKLVGMLTVSAENRLDGNGY